MDSRKIVYRETGIIAVGELIGSALMLLAFWAFDRFSAQVLLSALAGCLTMIANYFIMAVTTSLAADRAEQGDVKPAQKMIQTSSIVRQAVMAVVLIVGIRLGANVLALVLPLLFARPTLMLAEFFRKKGD